MVELLIPATDCMFRSCAAGALKSRPPLRPKLNLIVGDQHFGTSMPGDKRINTLGVKDPFRTMRDTA
jgi:hypothetical protein